MRTLILSPLVCLPALAREKPGEKPADGDKKLLNEGVAIYRKAQAEQLLTLAAEKNK